MPDPGSPWERDNPGDGFGYLPWPIRTDADQAAWDRARVATALARDKIAAMRAEKSA